MDFCFLVCHAFHAMHPDTNITLAQFRSLSGQAMPKTTGTHRCTASDKRRAKGYSVRALDPTILPYTCCNSAPHITSTPGQKVLPGNFSIPEPDRGNAQATGTPNLNTTNSNRLHLAETARQPRETTTQTSPLELPPTQLSRHRDTRGSHTGTPLDVTCRPRSLTNTRPAHQHQSPPTDQNMLHIGVFNTRGLVTNQTNKCAFIYNSIHTAVG